MSPEVEKELKEKYPKCFATLHYFECADGWRFLIESIAQVIEREIESCESAEIADMYAACQVKEKFGTLRFYCWGGNDKIFGAISAIESMSCHTCEECGNVGEIRDLPWIRTLCEKHFNEKESKS